MNMGVHGHLYSTAEPIEPHSQVRHGRRRKGSRCLPHRTDQTTALLVLMLGLVLTLVLTLVLIRSRSALPDAMFTRRPPACVSPIDASSQSWSVAQSQGWRS